MCSLKGSISTKFGNCSSWQTFFSVVFQMLEWNWNCVLENELLPTFKNDNLYNDENFFPTILILQISQTITILPKHSITRRFVR